MLTFEEYKKERDLLTSLCYDTGKVLSGYPKNEMGMTVESIRQTDTYKNQRSLYQKNFNLLRKLNGTYVKLYKKELAAERAARWENH